MRIAHIVASLAPDQGGPSRSVRALASALARPDQAVAVFTTGPRPETVVTPDNVTVATFPRAHPRRLARAPGLSAALLAWRPDAVHHHGLWLRTLHDAHRVARRLRVPLIVSPRGMMNRWAWRHHRLRKVLASVCIHPGALRHVDGWHATSDEEAADIRSLGFRQPICVAPNGVDLPSEADLAAARDHWSRAAPDPLNRRTALFHSRFHRKKRVLELLDLWATLAPPDWRLLLVGIPDEYPLDALQRRVLELGLTDRVQVFDGTLTPAPYAAASLFLLPSHSENFGLVVAEALAASVPAVVADGAPWSELPARGAGWWVPWADFGVALRAGLQESPAQLAARGAAGRAWMGTSFGWSAVARPLDRFYGDLVAVRRSVPHG